MKYLLLLAPVTALVVNVQKPYCTKVDDVGVGGNWKVIEEKLYDKMPDKISRGPYRGIQVGCEYDKFMMYEPKTCRLPYHATDLKKRPERVVFMGDSVMDQSAQSFSWFMQKENRIVDARPCQFHKDEWKAKLTQSGKFSEETIKDTVLWMEKQGGNNLKNGHLWWGCQKNSSVLYVPLMTTEWQNPELVKALMYLVKTFPYGNKPLGSKDVLVMNWGLHGLKDGNEKNLVHMDRKWTPALTSLLNEWKEWNKDGTAPKLIWRQVSPQHFGNAGGMWSAGVKRDCQAIGNIHALRQDPAKYPTKNDQMFFNAVKDAGLEVDGKDIAFLPIWEPSAQRWDEHPTSDCTHYCQYGAVNRYWNSAMLAVGSGMIKK